MVKRGNLLFLTILTAVAFLLAACGSSADVETETLTEAEPVKNSVVLCNMMDKSHLLSLGQIQ